MPLSAAIFDKLFKTHLLRAAHVRQVFREPSGSCGQKLCDGVTNEARILRGFGTDCPRDVPRIDQGS